jgi:hypothetical protein
VLASNRRAVLFSRGGERFYGCLKALGVTRLLLDERFNFYFHALIAVRLAGRFAALEPAYSNGSAAWKDATLYDLRSGKARHLAEVRLDDPEGSTGNRLDFLALDSSGFAAWRETSRPVPSGLAAMSCPSASLCVAGDDDGNILTSTDPLGGSDAWSRTGADQVQGIGQDIVGVSCASVSLCVVVDGEGNIVASTDPTGGQSAWSKTHFSSPPNVGFDGVSCPSVSLCVAATDAGKVLTSTDPTGGARSWSSARVGSGGDVWAVSCPSVSLCVAGTGAGDVLTSTDPTGGASAWKRTPTGPGGSPVASISCPSVSLCVALTDAGDVLTSTDPTGGASAWRKAKLDPTGSLLTVSCPSVSLCVAVNFNNIFTSTNPTGGRGAWMKVPADRAHSLHTVSCASVSMCVAADNAGNILTSTDPDDGANAWSRPTVVPGCPRPSTPCISEQLYAHDHQGTRVVDTAPPGHGNSIGNVALASRVLNWTHDGAQRQLQLR